MKEQPGKSCPIFEVSHFVISSPHSLRRLKTARGETVIMLNSQCNLG